MTASDNVRGGWFNHIEIIILQKTICEELHNVYDSCGCAFCRNIQQAVKSHFVFERAKEWQREEFKYLADMMAVAERSLC